MPTHLLERHTTLGDGRMGGLCFVRKDGWGFLGGLAQLVEEGMSYFKSWARSPNVVLLISYLD